MEAVLVDVRSIQNVATCFRTADGIGISKMWLTGYTPGPLDKYGIAIPKFTRISLGAEESIAWEKGKDVLSLINDLKEAGKFVVAIETGEKAIPYNKLKLKNDLENVVLIMGNETEGLSNEVLDLCDVVLEIPMHGEKESLNVAMAFGIAGFVLRDFCG